MRPEDESIGVWTRELLHKGRKFDLEKVTRADGSGVSREVIRHPGAVAILPILETPGRDPQVLFVHNERAAVGKRLLELPAGTREQGEPPELTAGRELIEETGYQAAKITKICAFYTTPGLTDELMHAYVARGLTFVGQRLEADESMTVVPVPANDTLGMIDRGELSDAKTILILLWAGRNGMLAPA
jgi:ADP-ribose pyrophosphatase